jgi:peptidoglycan/LPS O-acetylase OafA/YrhL
MNIKRSVFYWAPRILGLAAIAFISMFALDSFEAGLPLTTQLLHFAQHLIPSFLLLALLALAWKWEKVGGIAFIGIGLTFSPLVYMLNHGRNHFSVAQSLLVVLIITVPFIITGALFLLSHSKRNTVNA